MAIAGIAIETGKFLAHSTAEYLYKESKSSYGKVKIALFSSLDFVEPEPLFEWERNKDRIINDMGFSRISPSEYLYEHYLHIKEFVVEPIISGIEDGERYLAEPEDIDEDFDASNQELLVKRVRIVGFPETTQKGHIGRSLVLLGRICEKFAGDIQIAKTFTGLTLVFEDEIKLAKFLKQLRKKFLKVEKKTPFAEPFSSKGDNTVTLLVVGFMDIEKVFQVVDKVLSAKSKEVSS